MPKFLLLSIKLSYKMSVIPLRNPIWMQKSIECHLTYFEILQLSSHCSWLLMPCLQDQNTSWMNLPNKIFDCKWNSRSLCPVHLPGQNIFCPDKKFCSRLKGSYLLMKRVKNDFLAMDKVLFVAKKSFSNHFTSKYVLFSIGQNLVRTKNILSRPKDWVLHF